MTSTQVNPAGAAVLATTELLEADLLHTDMKTVLLAQRVSHKFNNVIDNSLRLQKMLFMVPTTIEEAIELCASSVKWSSCDDGSSFTLFKRKTDCDSGPPRLSEMHVPNLLLFARLETTQELTNVLKLPCLPAHTGKKHRLMEGSWRKMYLAHPCALKVVGDLSTSHGMGYHWNGYWDASAPDVNADLTVGSLLEDVAMDASRTRGRTVVWGKSTIWADVSVDESYSVGL